MLHGIKCNHATQNCRHGMQVLLEDASAVFTQVLKYLSGSLTDIPGIGNLNSDLIYLRDPLNPYVRRPASKHSIGM